MSSDDLNAVFWRCTAAANVALWGASFGCLALDSCPSLTKYKCQGARSYFTLREWLEAAAVALINMTIVARSTFGFFTWLWMALHAHPTSENDAWEWRREAACLAGCVLTVDVWFYWTHRLLHWGPLYRHVHKMHHRFKAPVSIAAVYAHPVEFIGGNLAGVALGPVLTNAHPLTAYLWFFIALFNTSCAHSGYEFLTAQKHDDHHRLFDWNYGVGPYTDKLFGTYWHGGPAKKKE